MTSLQTIKESIVSAGFTWNTVSEQDFSQGVKSGSSRLGLVYPAKARAATLKMGNTRIANRAMFAFAPPPEAIDWRSHNSKSFVTAVRNQQMCGSCVSFAVCASIESRLARSLGSAKKVPDLSEAHLFFCGAGMACNLGWYPEEALKFAKKKGIGLESDFPYTPVDQACKNVAPAVKVLDWTALTSREDRKQAIANEGPVIASMAVFEDFYAYKSGVYRHAAGKLLGYHAVCVVGYSNKDECWIVKNSWGTSWGEKGFFRIGYGECQVDSRFAFLSPSVQTVSETLKVKAVPKKRKGAGRGSAAKRMKPG